MPTERYEDVVSRREAERRERLRVYPDPCSETFRLLPSAGDVTKAVTEAAFHGPAGVIYKATERGGDGGAFKVYGVDAERLVRRGGRADADGNPVPRGGWSFPRLDDLRERLEDAREYLKSRRVY